jgi:FolB domain-containing protein
MEGRHDLLLDSPSPQQHSNLVPLDSNLSSLPREPSSSSSCSLEDEHRFRDKISINDLTLQAIVGVNKKERITRQNININVTMFHDITAAAINDDVTKTINYSLVYKDVVKYTEHSKHYTLESLSTGIARVCCLGHGVDEVIVTVEKPCVLSLARSPSVQVRRTRKFFLEIEPLLKEREKEKAKAKEKEKEKDKGKERENEQENKAEATNEREKGNEKENQTEKSKFETIITNTNENQNKVTEQIVKEKEKEKEKETGEEEQHLIFFGFGK